MAQAVLHIAPDYYIDPAQIYEGPSVIDRFLEYGRRRLKEIRE